jgi:TRAP-type C4-dicarboxylate transport system substrate-binding protein
MTTLGHGARRLFAAAAMTALASGAAVAQDVTLRLHQFLPAQSAVPAEVLVPWMEKVTAESDGRIAFEHYPAMQLGGRPPELIDQVIDGIADVVWTLPGYTPGRFPRVEVFELPFMMTNAEATSRALWQVAEAEMLATDFADVHVIGLWVHGPGVIHSKRPIVDVADLQGMNLRGPTRATTNLISALGANAVGMPVPQVPESLSRGVIDGTVIPWEVTGSLRTSELVEHHTEFPGAPLYTAVFLLAMNKATYEGLPDDLRAVIDANSGLAFSENAGRVSEAADAGPRAFAVERGNSIVELTPEQVDAWRTAAQPTIDAWVEEATAAGLDGQGLLDAARDAIAANSGS